MGKDVEMTRWVISTTERIESNAGRRGGIVVEGTH
jgi:hypothetical protein